MLSEKFEFFFFILEFSYNIGICTNIAHTNSLHPPNNTIIPQLYPHLLHKLFIMMDSLRKNMQKLKTHILTVSLLKSFGVGQMSRLRDSRLNIPLRKIFKVCRLSLPMKMKKKHGTISEFCVRVPLKTHFIEQKYSTRFE